MQDSTGFLYGFFIFFRPKTLDISWENIGQYGMTIIPAISRNTFPENSALRRPIQPFSGSVVGTVGKIPGKGNTLSGSRVSDGELVVRPPPCTPKYGEFRNKGAIRLFSSPI